MFPLALPVFKDDTILTDVVKPHGYHGCMAIACRPGSHKTIPLALKLWSSSAEGHLSENEEVLDIQPDLPGWDDVTYFGVG